MKNVKQNSLLNKIPDTTTKTNKPCPKEYEEIYKLLSSVPKHINNIIKASNQNSSKVSSILTMLEIEGLVESLPGGFFKLI
ncbi:MAG: hypothetical protein LBL91_03265 [Lachnospiraceae bacterium]|nr:hypothetical protein [Lachnospiraceae bacterium]